MKKTVSILLSVILLGIFSGCKKGDSDGDSLDKKIKASQTINASGTTETGETLEEDLKKWREEGAEAKDVYTEVVPLDYTQVDADTPYTQELQKMQGILRALGARLNQYYALYRLYPSGTKEAVLQSIKTKDPTNEDLKYEIICAEDSCTLAVTFNSKGSLLRAEDKQEGKYWPLLMYRLFEGEADKDGFITVHQYLFDQDASGEYISVESVALDDFIKHEEICESLGGIMKEFGCVLKEKMSPDAKKDSCSELGGEIKDGECVLKEENFRFW